MGRGPGVSKTAYLTLIYSYMMTHPCAGFFSVNQKTQIVDKREKNVEEQGFGRVKMDYEG